MEIHPGQPLDLSLQLPRDMYYQVTHTLCDALPPPITDSPEDLIRRDNAAIAQVASMLPGNAQEANLAAVYVALQARAMASLRLIDRPDMDTKLVLKCTAQSLGLMRETNATLRLFLRLQSDRAKREADNTTLNQSEWIEHCAIGLMADALGRTPPAPIEQPAAPPPAEPLREHEPKPDLIAEAEQYAIIHPRRAALIRRLRGLPARCDFGPPPPDLLHAIIHGTTPHLTALDTPAKATAEATA